LSGEDLQYSFLPIIKILTSTTQRSLLVRIKNKFNISENISTGQQKIPADLLSEIMLFCETQNETGIAFFYGLYSESGSLGLLDYYLASCNDLEAAANQLIYFFPLISDAKFQPNLLINSQQQIEFSIAQSKSELPKTRIVKELIFASVIALITRLSNHKWPVKIDLPQQSFSNVVYEKLTSLGINLNFTSAKYRFVLDVKQHQVSLPFSNEKTRDLLKPELEQLLLETKHSESIIAEILMLFTSEKHVENINQNLISEKLNISESNLKRKLSGVGSNFSSILSSFKRERAIELLNKQSLTMEMISNDLGYSDRSSFERAFKQWTNITPSQYVQQMSLAELKLENIKAADIDSLPTSPKICQQVFELTNSDDFDIPQLSNLIQTDPILTGKLMSIANSAYYGGKNVADINQAIIQVLGVDVVQNMVFSLMCCSQMKVENCPKFDLQSFWFQSLFTAESIKLLSQHGVIKTDISASEIYLAALLHKIGEYVLAYLKPKIMNRYLSLNHHSNEFSENRSIFIEGQNLQKKIFGLSVETTGALILTHWGLPKKVCDLVRTMNTIYSDQSETSKVLTLISLFARHQLYNLEETDLPNELLQELSDVLDVEISVLSIPLIKIVNEIESIDAISKEISNED